MSRPRTLTASTLRALPRWVFALLFFAQMPAMAQPPSGAEPPGSTEPVPTDVQKGESLHAARLAALRQALGQHRHLMEAGGWGTLGPGEALRLGSEGQEVIDLRVRLERSGDLTSTSDRSFVFDDRLESAARHFQRRHGLDVDGIVGPATRRALDVPVGTRVRQLEASIRDWTALPADLGTRSVLVNIPAFEVEALETDRSVLRLRAVVGRTDRPTTILSSRIDAVALSPYWNVPPGIARLDVIPEIRRDRGYLARNRMRVFSRESGRELNPAAVDWATVSPRTILIRQEPGGRNPMGRVKIFFPNDHNVFLHDTPDQQLFERASRAFSSACVRIEDALDLAEWILAREPAWSRARIDEVVAENREKWVSIRQAVPIHLVYLTAWTDAAGVTHFRHDLYQRHGFP